MPDLYFQGEFMPMHRQVGSTLGPGGSSASSILGGIAPRHTALSSSFAAFAAAPFTIVPLTTPGVCMPVTVDDESTALPSV